MGMSCSPAQIDWCSHAQARQDDHYGQHPGFGTCIRLRGAGGVRGWHSGEGTALPCVDEQQPPGRFHDDDRARQVGCACQRDNCRALQDNEHHAPWPHQRQRPGGHPLPHQRRHARIPGQSRRHRQERHQEGKLPDVVHAAPLALLTLVAPTGSRHGCQGAGARGRVGLWQLLATPKLTPATPRAASACVSQGLPQFAVNFEIER